MVTGACGARGLRRGMVRGERGGLPLPLPRPVNPRGRSGLACQARRKGGDKNVVCNKMVIAKEGSEGEVQELCASYAEDMKANAVGILSFECTKDTHDGKQFHFWERYKNVSYFNENMSSEKTQGFLKDLSPLVEKPVGVSLFEYANGQIGSACVEVGPKGEGGLDDATGANKYGGGARYEQTSTAVQL
ncbi:hypothetical protein HOP50_09g54000 [Chloropicon primus]|uniref:ABM domain-containing protein n=1 Tax=Chloropicon primus TaxID=1764295 RepID=A0A5B8MTU5_9CHLO|nr:hypothetical protein A3770_09p53700 [Chloropicon primus]UPR02076.1 hypothetical protein HOP50_09g54000 [Chloropicon primus]|mmetsp:Transcript_11301/g.31477  ORF Transcript_11301/g.31477 Transcript_11301/m.31477 type:complete len:189 (+) Transcript_11301:200-766(+)|eukprot:QDZ22852.1 hypothetical protein A3770_09p53700 [Chloropicon primus]